MDDPGSGQRNDRISKWLSCRPEPMEIADPEETNSVPSQDGWIPSSDDDAVADVSIRVNNAVGDSGFRLRQWVDATRRFPARDPEETDSAMSCNGRLHSSDSSRNSLSVKSTGGYLSRRFRLRRRVGATRRIPARDPKETDSAMSCNGRLHSSDSSRNSLSVKSTGGYLSRRFRLRRRVGATRRIPARDPEETDSAKSCDGRLHSSDSSCNSLSVNSAGDYLTHRIRLCQWADATRRFPARDPEETDSAMSCDCRLHSSDSSCNSLSVNSAGDYLTRRIRLCQWADATRRFQARDPEETDSAKSCDGRLHSSDSSCNSLSVNSAGDYLTRRIRLCQWADATRRFPARDPEETDSAKSCDGRLHSSDSSCNSLSVNSAGDYLSRRFRICQWADATRRFPARDPEETDSAVSCNGWLLSSDSSRDSLSVISAGGYLLGPRRQMLPSPRDPEQTDTASSSVECDSHRQEAVLSSQKIETTDLPGTIVDSDDADDNSVQSSCNIVGNSDFDTDDAFINDSDNEADNKPMDDSNRDANAPAANDSNIAPVVNQSDAGSRVTDSDYGSRRVREGVRAPSSWSRSSVTDSEYDDVDNSSDESLFDELAELIQEPPAADGTRGPVDPVPAESEVRGVEPRGSVQAEAGSKRDVAALLIEPKLPANARPLEILALAAEYISWRDEL